MTSAGENGMLPVPERGFISSRPAENWEEGLITGNGTLGLNAYSRPNEERIIFTHEELFMPMGEPTVPPDQSADLPKIRELIAEGKYKEAERLQFENTGQEGFMYPDFYVPAFDLTIKREAQGEVRDYSRTVDFATAEATVQFTDDAGTFRREIFASRKDGVAVIRIIGEEPGSLDLDLKLEPRESSDEFNKDTDIAKRSDESFKEHFGDLKSAATKDSLSFSARFLKAYPGSIQSLNGHARVVAKGGESSPNADGSLTVKDADEILILADIRLPREKGVAEFDALAAKLAAVPTNYDKLLKRHAKIHGEIFKRVKLDIGGSPEDHLKSTEELLEISTWQDINKALIEKQFDAGRYNILCSTGKLPPNLQGIWGGTYVPNWASDYTHNGNVPSAIAANLPGNMPKLTLAYTSYIESLIPDMELNAKHFFGARGIVLPSRSSTHGYNNAMNPNFAGGMWVAGAGKAAHFFYDYYLYTGDEEFLAEHAIPFMEKVVLFFQDYLYEGPDGKWIFSPTQSPENWPEGSKSQATYNATMDVAVAKEVLNNLIEGSRILGVNEDKIPVWENMLAKMPPYMLNDEGIIKEWLTPRLGNNDKHRHSSQLYPLYYMMPDEIEADPELKEGFRKSVEFKLAEHWKDPTDRGFMSFGLVQLGQVVSTLGDSELSYLCLRHLVNRFWLNNLASMHNHRHLFNMDISGGQPALIIQMLVGSELGKIRLLPALPEQWPEGSIEGVLARGAIEIERMEWNPEEVEVALRSDETQTITLELGGTLRTVTLPAGRTERIRLER
ncbi:MAG TPA: glycoside hydrolase N-terminal domain-containing protein [Opitutales bacterium]|nr:glycoside hydrolase N-terminal domain-containing protein [Opitutales bacterium]